MAESTSPALPGDVEWLPGPGGARVLRIHPATAEPPALVLRLSGGGERHLSATPGAATEYAIPADLTWTAAWLQWPDGTRAALPLPHGRHAEVIQLRPRRFARGPDAGTTTPDETSATALAVDVSAPGERVAGDISARGERVAADVSAPGELVASDISAPGEPVAGDVSAPGERVAGDISARAERVAGDISAPGERVAGDVSAPGERVAGDISAPRESSVPGASAAPAARAPDATAPLDISAPEPPADVGDAAPAWTTPPQLSDSTQEAEAVWRERRDDLRRELAEAADAIARARDGERAARDSVLTALAAARADLRASRAAREADASLLTAVSGELEVERAAHAVTRGSVGTLADALAAARAELAANKTRAEATALALEAARAELAAARATNAAELADAHRDATQARAEVVTLRQALESERARPAPAKADLERFAREQADAAATAARRPPEESARLLANLDAAAAALRASAPHADLEDIAGAPSESGPPESAPPGHGATARGSSADAGKTDLRAAEHSSSADAGTTPLGAAEQTSDADADAGATAIGATQRSPGADAGTTALGTAEQTSGADAGTTALDAAEQTSDPGDNAEVTEPAPSHPATRSTALVAASADRRLRRALVALARDDSVTAGALLVGLLPAQGALLETVMTYDLTVRGVGTFAVFVDGSTARVVRQSRRRPRSEALFHLSAEPLVLAELLAGDRDKVGRFRRRAKVSGRRKRMIELAPLRNARLSLAQAVTAGARLEPGLVYQALPHAIDPQWTRGHTFTVAQRIVELAPQTWHISARDGLPLRVTERRTDARADAVVTMSKAAFERMLRDEPPLPSDRPQIRGDRDAVAALKRWTDLARR